MDRRGFLQGILALGVAPAIVKAEILMPVRKLIVPSPEIFIPRLWAENTVASLSEELERMVAAVYRNEFTGRTLVVTGAIKAGENWQALAPPGYLYIEHPTKEEVWNDYARPEQRRV